MSDARIPDHAAWAARGRWREAYDALLAALPAQPAQGEAERALCLDGLK